MNVQFDITATMEIEVDITNKNIDSKNIVNELNNGNYVIELSSKEILELPSLKKIGKIEITGILDVSHYDNFKESE